MPKGFQKAEPIGNIAGECQIARVFQDRGYNAPIRFEAWVRGIEARGLTRNIDVMLAREQICPNTGIREGSEFGIDRNQGIDARPDRRQQFLISDLADGPMAGAIPCLRSRSARERRKDGNHQERKRSHCPACYLALHKLCSFARAGQDASRTFRKSSSGPSRFSCRSWRFIVGATA